MNRFLHGAAIAALAAADEFSIERVSRLTEIANLASPTLCGDAGTDDATYIKYNAYTGASDNMVWDMCVKSVFKEDDGEIYLRIMHKLTADITSAQIVTFQFAFTSASDPYFDRKNNLAQDVARCYAYRNSQDTRFWVQTASDGTFKCSDEICSAPNTDWNDDTSPSDVDWTNPIVDEDNNNRFCTPHATNSATYAC